MVLKLKITFQTIQNFDLHKIKNCLLLKKKIKLILSLCF